MGQHAYLRMVPDRDVAVALFTNGGSPRGLYVEIFGHVLRELAGVELPPFPEPVAGARVVNASRYLGVYTSTLADMTVSQDPDGRIWADWTPRGLYAELGVGPRSDTNWSPWTATPWPVRRTERQAPALHVRRRRRERTRAVPAQRTRRPLGRPRMSRQPNRWSPMASALRVGVGWEQPGTQVAELDRIGQRADAGRGQVEPHTIRSGE